MSRSYDPETTELKGLMLLEASAGTGKTYALERMVARLVSRGEHPLEISSVLVVTFTNRAAREMKERIRKLLSARFREDDRPEGERRLCGRALADFDRAPIYTIHGFCQMVLSTWPFESDAPFTQDLEPGGQLELQEARRWLAGLTRGSLDSELLQAVYDRAGSVEALAGAIALELSGDRIPPGSRLVPDPEQAAAFALFAADSAREDSPLSEAFARLMTAPLNDEAINPLIRSAGKKRGKTVRILDAIRGHLDSCSGIKGLIPLTTALFSDPAELKIGSHFLELWRAGVQFNRGEAVNPEVVEPGSESEVLAAALEALFSRLEPYVGFTEAGGKHLENLTGGYLWQSFLSRAAGEVGPLVKRKKDSEGRWGYTDLIRRVAEAVSRVDSPLPRLLRSRFQAALIDEFQDTDPRQWALFFSLFGRPPHLLAMIGDPKQSIYGFRGTGLQAYNAARSRVPESGQYRLDTNYRSEAFLVNAVDRLFEPLFSRGCGENRPVGFMPVKSGKVFSDRLDLPAGEKRITLLDIPAPPAAEGGLNRAASRAAAAEIRRLLDPVNPGMYRGGPAGSGDEKLKASDIAVLVRSEFQEDLVLQELQSIGIPGIRIRSRTVFARPVVPLLVSLLRALDRPGDAGHWRTLLLGDFFGIPPGLLQKFEESGRLDELVEQGSLWRSRFLNGEALAVLHDFFSFSSTISSWSDQEGSAGYAVLLSRPWPHRLLAGPDGRRHWQDWKQLCDLMQLKQAEGLREPAQLIRWLQEAEGSDPEGRQDAVRLETEDPAIKVMTMHASKGLEFPVVFLLGGLSGKSARKPDGEYRFDDNGVLTVDRLYQDRNRSAHLAYEWEEDKRLWYVAFTRASRALTVIRPREGGFSMVESLLVQGLGLRPADGLPPHQILDAAGGEALRAELQEALLLHQADPEGFLSLKSAEFEALLPLPPAPVPEPQLAGHPPKNLSRRDPSTSSYTSLVRAARDSSLPETGADRDVDDHGAEPLPGKDSPSEEIPLQADRGALFGTLVHSLFEHCDFAAAADDDETTWLNNRELDDLFRSLAGRCYHPDWYRSRSAELKRMVRRTLRAPLPGLGRLCDLEKDSRRAEVEFLSSLPQDFTLRSDDFNFSVPRGFLKGFIDLLIRSGDRWWVLDWKTNLPSGEGGLGAYEQEELVRIMDHHQYHLQYELYLLSLCRSLAASRKDAIDWDHEIGGALYLFVRGMREEDSRGVFPAIPEKARMMELADQAGIGGIIR